MGLVLRVNLPQASREWKRAETMRFGCSLTVGNRHDFCWADPPVSTGGLLHSTPSKPRAGASGQERRNIAT